MPKIVNLQKFKTLLLIFSVLFDQFGFQTIIVNAQQQQKSSNSNFNSLSDPLALALEDVFSSVDPCLYKESQQSCENCIKAASNCAWMEKGVFDETKTKCFSKAFTDGALPDGAIYPAESSYKVEEETGNNKYISPRNVELELRPGASKSFDITFNVHKTYPVDLYYLFDLSTSMKQAIKYVADQSQKVTEVLLEEIGDELSIGIGSFIEKPTYPYTNQGGQHVFKQHKKLSKVPKQLSTRNKWLQETKQEIEAIKQQTKGNNDNEEAGFEALVQAAVCENFVGWDETSRHFVVYSSDALAHTAGNAMVAGINVPNDLKCHVKGQTGVYDAAFKQDYPSINEVKTVLNDKNIQTIFNVIERPLEAEDVSGWYKNVTKSLGSGHQVIVSGKSVRESPKSGDVFTKSDADLPKHMLDTYRKLTSEIRLNVKGLPDDYEMTVETYCIHENESVARKSADNMACINPKRPASNEKRDVEKTQVKFSINLKLKEGHCPEPAEITINTPGFGGSERVALKLTSNCSCKGECKTKYSSLKCRSNQECSGHGKFSCGVCQCDPGYSGDCCDCQIGNEQQEKAKHKMCYPDGSDRICSGRGTCICGRCECDLSSTGGISFFGDKCQCTAGSCPSVNDQPCAGNGQCVCGTCKCNKGFEGEDCNCPKATDQCYPSEKSKIKCNNNGKCECNQCMCKRDDTQGWKFKGKHCNQFEVSCDRYMSCVREKHNCDLSEWKKDIPVDVITKRCEITRDDGAVCKYTGAPAYDDLLLFEVASDLTYKVIEKSNCGPTEQVAQIVLWTIASTILLGLLIILAIKIIIEWLNYKEYKEINAEEKEFKNNDEVVTGF